MSSEKEIRKVRIADRIQQKNGHGERCVTNFVEVLEEEGVDVPRQVIELTPALEWGIGGTGSVCGVFLSAVLTKALETELGLEPDSESVPSQMPTNDLLDMITPPSSEITIGQRAYEVARRLNSYANERFGVLDCRSIAGTDWPGDSAMAWSSYFSTGGAERCTEIMGEAVTALIDSFERTHS